jgi:DNA repair protein RecO (recombination protein O)
MKPLATHGIILRRIEYGEADRIITFLSSDYGKIRVIAKGVRKSKSKLAGGIELFSTSELHFIKGKSDIGTLVSTRMVKHYGAIVKDLERTELAYQMLKTIDRVLEDGAGQEYFSLLNESLAALDTPAIPLITVELSFKMRLLSATGHVPDFMTDISGSRLDPDAQYEFDFEHVAFKPVSEGPFNKNHLKVLKLLAYNSPQRIAAVQGISSYADSLASLVRGLAGQYIPN